MNNESAIKCLVTNNTIITNANQDIIVFPNSISSLSFYNSDLDYKYIPTILNALNTVSSIEFNTYNSLFVQISLIIYIKISNSFIQLNSRT